MLGQQNRCIFISLTTDPRYSLCHLGDMDIEACLGQ